MRSFASALAAAVMTAVLLIDLSAQSSAPRIISLSPSSAIAGASSVILTVNGEHFGNAGQGVIVRWNGIDRPTTYVNSTQLRVAIGAADLSQAANVPVTVFLPLGGGALSSPVSYPVLEGARPTSFYIGGPDNPKRVWGGTTVTLNLTRGGAAPSAWRVAPTATALPTSPWKSMPTQTTYTFAPWRANDCGLLPDPTQYARTHELHFQYGTVFGKDTIASAAIVDQVDVRLPWCTPIQTVLPPQFVGLLTSRVGHTHCAVGTVMNGLRARTHKEFKVTPIGVEVIPHITQVGAICNGSSRAMVGTTLGEISLDATFGPSATTFLAVVPSAADMRTLGAFPIPLPAWLNGQLAYDPLYARVVNGTISGSGVLNVNCPTNGAPIGLNVFRAADGQAVGLAMLCVVSDAPAKT